MLKSLIRTFKGPSRDPRMSYISRPLPRDLPYEQVVEALEIALAANPDPAYLPETLPPALLQVTGRSFEVLDRSVRDVTGTFRKTQVMIRDGDVGRWPGYAAMSYPLLAPSAKAEEARAAIAAADGADGEAAPAGPKPGWAPPPPPDRQWLELGYECPHCGEQLSEANVYAWRPVPEDPKLLLIYCPDCGDRVEINHV
jgi:DNA-directed RNA polymerase subunit RPC12/RpoP